MSALDALPVDYLFRMELELGSKQVMPRGPQGTRVYAQVAGGRVEGPRLSGTVAPGAAWVTVRADGSAQLEVRLVITADDGAVIFMEYKGLLGSDGIPRTAPLFQASAEQHQWLNHVQGIGIGTSTDTGVTYEVYALR